MTSTPEPSLATKATASPDKIRSALLRYRVMAWITGLWLLLLVVELVAKYGFGARPGHQGPLASRQSRLHAPGRHDPVPVVLRRARADPRDQVRVHGLVDDSAVERAEFTQQPDELFERP